MPAYLISYFCYYNYSSYPIPLVEGPPDPMRWWWRNFRFRES